jgi:hypothetical protein
MADTSHVTKQFEAAERLQSQFRFYFVSLVFTLLAVSIQTAKFGDSRVQSASELLGWLLFAVSGLVALSYLEWEPLIREQLAHRDNYDHQLAEARTLRRGGVAAVQLASSGTPQSTDERIANLESSAQQLTIAAKGHLRRAGVKYEIWRWSFVLALCAMLVARGGPAFAKIFGYDLL